MVLDCAIELCFSTIKWKQILYLFEKKQIRKKRKTSAAELYGTTEVFFRLIRVHQMSTSLLQKANVLTNILRALF
tara:strand:- start:169 stop:393 length:225 start_codon:yes stop_codon:yes gene_type:complete